MAHRRHFPVVQTVADGEVVTPVELQPARIALIFGSYLPPSLTPIVEDYEECTDAQEGLNGHGLSDGDNHAMRRLHFFDTDTSGMQTPTAVEIVRGNRSKNYELLKSCAMGMMLRCNRCSHTVAVGVAAVSCAAGAVLDGSVLLWGEMMCY